MTTIKTAQLRQYPIDTIKMMSRFGDRLNMSEKTVWDVKNGYIDKEANIQQRSGVAKYNATAIIAEAGVVTMTIASPSLFTFVAHDLQVGDRVHITTTGALPTGLTAGTIYFIHTRTDDTFHLSETLGGGAINTSGSQSGVHTLYSYAVKIKFLYEVRASDGTRRMIARAGTGWWKDTAGNGIFESFDGSRTNDAQGDAVMAQAADSSDLLIMVDGGAPRMVAVTAGGTIGTPAALGGTPPAAPTAIHTHNGHIIMNNTTAGKETLVYVSAFRNAQDYTTQFDSLILDMRYVLPDNDVPIGFATVGEDYLVILCKRYVVIYNAPESINDWNIKGIYPTGGITNFASVKHPTSDLLFIPGLENINGFFVGGQLPSDPFLAIAPLYRSYLSTLTSSNWKYINGGVSKKLNHYYISFPLSAGHEILVFSFDHNSVVGRYTGLTMWSFCEREDGTVLIGGAGGQVYTMNSGTNDDGVAISFAIDTPYYYPGNKSNYKVCRKFQALVNYTVAFTFYLDWVWDTQAGGTITKSITTNSLNRQMIETENITGRGRGIALTIRHATLNVIITVPFWSFSYINEGTK